MNKISWSIFAILTVGIFALLIFISNQSEIDFSKINIDKVQAASSDNGNIADHTYGNKNSKVIVMEYADYQCPGCAGVSPIVQAAIETYKDKVLLVFRNFPLTSAHANAKLAAASAEAAGLQGKYWEMHYKIFEQQQEWSTLTGEDRINYFVDLAKELKLDTKKFKSDIASSEVSRKISFDQALGGKAKVNQTPTVFINGKMLKTETLNTVDSLEEAIAKEIK